MPEIGQQFGGFGACIASRCCHVRSVFAWTCAVLRMAIVQRPAFPPAAEQSVKKPVPCGVRGRGREVERKEEIPPARQKKGLAIKNRLSRWQAAVSDVSEHVYAVFTEWWLLGKQADHFFRRTWLWLWSVFIMRGLELDNGLEESHGLSFQVVRGVASLSNVFCP